MQRAPLIGRWLVLVGLVGCGGRAANGSGSANQTSKLTSGAWDLTLPLRLSAGFAAGSDQETACTSLKLTLDLVDEGDTLNAFLGADGQMGAASFNRSKDNSLVMVAPLSLRGIQGCSSAAGIDFNSLTLRAEDTDGDGRPDHLEGDGNGAAHFNFGDEADEAEMAFSVAGAPDRTAPSVETQSGPLSPLDPVLLNVSEPLQSAMLSLAGSPVIDFPSPATGDALFQLTSDRVLPFSGSWTLAGGGQDFAGLSVGLGSAFATLADPGLFAQDGFEGPLAATLNDGATVIDVTSGIALPNGKRALLVPPNSSATLHLAGSPNSFSRLTMTFARLVGDAAQLGLGSGIVTAEVAVIGGTKRSVNSLEPRGSDVTAISNERWKVESSPTVLSVPLSEQGSDVAVRFSVTDCGDLPCPPGALVIDDLKLE